MPVETLDDFETWDPKSQEIAGKMLKRAVERTTKTWYCKRGRACDGKPHEGTEYPHARGHQYPPQGTDWLVWALLAGRGGGKTRSATEWVRVVSKKYPRIAGVGRRNTDIRATMVEGDSGLIKVCEAAGVDYDWKPSKKEFTFENGSTVYFYTAEEPDSLRGPQHYAAWLDEPAHMPLIGGEGGVWDNLLLGLRLGPRPMILVTTTPLPTKWMKDLVEKDDTAVVKFSTYENLDNLAPTFRKTVLDKYEGTRLGQQELHGDIVDDVEGALWNSDLILSAHGANSDDFDGVPYHSYAGHRFQNIVVAVDPAGTSTKRSDETGIIVVARIGKQFFVLDDASGQHTPNAWAKEVVRLYEKWGANRVVVEKNFGGDMVTSNLRNEDAMLPISTVTSRRGKEIRAEPIVALYEQARVFHVGNLSELETQMKEWVPDKSDSPDRVDALVHGITYLAEKSGLAIVSRPGGKHDSRSAQTKERKEAPVMPGRAVTPIPSRMQTGARVWKRR